MIKYILILNKQGQTRLSKYYEDKTVKERVSLEAELVRKCMSRNPSQCSFIEFRDHKVVYRRYASLFFIVGLENEDNELAAYEFIHHYLVIMDKIFQNICELDIMLNLDTAHYVLDEMVLNGLIVETNKTSVADAVSQFVRENRYIV